MRVKTLCSVMLTVAGLAFATTAQAQDNTTPPPEAAPPPVAPAAPVVVGSRILIGGDLQLALPLGDLGDAAGFGFGLLARGEYVLQPNLNLTGRIGYVHHLENNGFGFSWIPILAGVKFFVTDMIYLAGEAGIFINRFTAEVPFFGSISDSSTNFGITAGAGARLGDLDLRLGLNVNDLGSAGDSLILVGSVGYNFARL